MSLMLHCGAEEVDYDALRQLETPPATATHVPIPHFRVVDMLRYTLGFYGHEITEEHHGVTKDAARYFGLLSLRSSYTGYEDTVALRNSHDKKFPIGVGFGSRVFVCDNLAFIADHVIKRKHTANAKRDLPGLIGDLVEPLAEQRERQHRTFELYKTTRLTDECADHAILDMYRDGVINIQRVADVVREWETPSFEEFQDERNAWRLHDSGIVLIENDQPQFVDCEKLRVMLRRRKPNFVYLNACYSGANLPSEFVLQHNYGGVVSAVLAAPIPNILCCRWAVSDEGAKTVATRFYECLFSEEMQGSISASLREAREAALTSAAGEDAWASPLLITNPLS